MSLLVIRIDARRYALPLSVVERVIRAVDVTPVPHAPPVVRGAINVQGCLVPVLSLRRRVGLPDREVTPADTFVLAMAGRRRVALIVDESDGVIQRHAEQIAPSTTIAPELTQLRGVTPLDGDLVLIYDLETFLSLEEARRLDDVMGEAGSGRE